MIDAIVTQIAAGLSSLQWITKLGTVARAHKVNDNGAARTLPVAALYGTDPVQYAWMIPDGNEAAVLYFEVLTDGVTSNGTARRLDCIAQIRVVCWLDTRRISTDTATAKANVVNAIAERYTVSDSVQNVRVHLQGFEPQTPAVFGRYTYDEKELQHLTPPFDFFSILLSIQYSATPSCAADTVLLDAPC